ncbi:MAG TPA: hypothetical protein PLP17_00560 [Oligoflexia bacterium]|nr:hypothetical protein [Oligoflexia bacterium]
MRVFVVSLLFISSFPLDQAAAQCDRAQARRMEMMLSRHGAVLAKEVKQLPDGVPQKKEKQMQAAEYFSRLKKLKTAPERGPAADVCQAYARLAGYYGVSFEPSEASVEHSPGPKSARAKESGRAAAASGRCGGDDAHGVFVQMHDEFARRFKAGQVSTAQAVQFTDETKAAAGLVNDDPQKACATLESLRRKLGWMEEQSPGQ